MKSLAQQLASLDFFVPERKVVRQLRCITGAISGHKYTAKMYVEYSDGVVEFVRDSLLDIGQTNVRLRIAGVFVWEENVSSAPGWFRCEDPYK